MSGNQVPTTSFGRTPSTGSLSYGKTTSGARAPGSHRKSSSSSSRFRSRISFTVLSMFASMAALYLAGRLWQDSESRLQLIQELDKQTGQGHAAVSVDENLKIIDCREQQKKFEALQMELGTAKKEGFVSNQQSSGKDGKKKLLAVVGIMTRFDRKNNRNAIRKAWMPAGPASKKLEDKGMIIRFVMGKSENYSEDRDIEGENRKTNDFIILNDLVEASKESAKKVKLFFAHAVEHWNAEFYVKVNDDIYVNIDALGTVLASHLDKPRIYLGCMKSGEVFSQLDNKWYEPEWWKFGDGKSYFRHASGELYAISQSLAKFLSINKSLLRSYAHDDVSAGSWFIGLDVKHVNDVKFCCSTWSSGSVCAAS